MTNRIIISAMTPQPRPPEFLFLEIGKFCKKGSRCGNRSRHNRYKSHFECSVCGYTNHADVNAAINIRDNYILSTTEKSVEQGSVNDPYESPGIAICNGPAMVDSSHAPCGRGS